jgi:hypothetical protein
MFQIKAADLNEIYISFHVQIFSFSDEKFVQCRVGLLKEVWKNVSEPCTSNTSTRHNQTLNVSSVSVITINYILGLILMLVRF